MQTIVFVEHMEDALPLGSGEAEEVHGGVVHAEERGEGTCLCLPEEMGMGGLTVAVGACQKVEIESPPHIPKRGEYFQVGIDAEETAEVHEEGEVEVGDGGGGLNHIEPLEGGLDVVVEGGVVLLFAQGGAEKFGEEEGDGGLDGREGHIHIIIICAHLGGTREFATVGTEVGRELDHRQGLPEGHASHGAFGALHRSHERLASTAEGEEVDDDGRVAILHRSEHDASEGFLHKTEHKDKKNSGVRS